MPQNDIPITFLAHFSLHEFIFKHNDLQKNCHQKQNCSFASVFACMLSVYYYKKLGEVFLKIYSRISVFILFFLSVLMSEAMDEFSSYIGPDTNDEIFDFFHVDPMPDEASVEKFIDDLNNYKIIKNIFKRRKIFKKRMEEKRVKVSSNEDIYVTCARQSEE